MSRKYFLDTEFHEHSRGIELISIGVVSDDNQEFYAVNSEYDQNQASQWLVDTVLENLHPGDPDDTLVLTPKAIAERIRLFCPPLTTQWRFGDTEFWGYYSSYDWYILCRLMGGMLHTPEGWPYYCKDIIQVMDHYRIPRDKLPPDPPNEHNALADARWNKKAYESLKQYIQQSVHRKVYL